MIVSRPQPASETARSVSADRNHVLRRMCLFIGAPSPTVVYSCPSFFLPPNRICESPIGCSSRSRSWIHMLCHLFPAHRKVRCCVFAEGCAKNIFSPRKKVVKIEHSEITARVCFIDGFRSRRPLLHSIQRLPCREHVDEQRPGERRHR